MPSSTFGTLRLAPLAQGRLFSPEGEKAFDFAVSLTSVAAALFVRGSDLGGGWANLRRGRAGLGMTALGIVDSTQDKDFSLWHVRRSSHRGMRPGKPAARRCAYVVPLEETASCDDVRSLARYLSDLGATGCDVLVLDGAVGEEFEEHRRILRWVALHVAAAPEHRTSTGAVDPIHAAADLLTTEKVIVARAEVRYSTDQIENIASLLDLHEVVEPQDYFSPLPWWSAIDAGRVLLHRSLEPYPDHGGTFAFRRSVVRGLRGTDVEVGDDHVRRLAAQGAEVYSVLDLFVRRGPESFHDWMKERIRQAEDDFAMPMKSAFFFSLLPIALILTLLGGVQMAAGYLGVVVFASTMLALRGRAGARAYFPLRACGFAPLWVLERSLSVYWALASRMSGAGHPAGSVNATERVPGERIAKRG